MHFLTCMKNCNRSKSKYEFLSFIQTFLLFSSRWPSSAPPAPPVLLFLSSLPQQCSSPSTASSTGWLCHPTPCPPLPHPSAFSRPGPLGAPSSSTLPAFPPSTRLQCPSVAASSPWAPGSTAPPARTWPKPCPEAPPAWHTAENGGSETQIDAAPGVSCL